MGVLDAILAAKRAEIRELAGRPLPPAPPPRALGLTRPEGEPLRLIAEIKRRSPSAGPLSTALSVPARAAAYERAGASMVSVLCDGPFFDGAFEHLALAREACALPLLCKDFVLDPLQLDLARAYGADAVLLIARCLDRDALPRLVRATRERGLVPFVEVVDEAEAERALEATADLIGVNARDLDTLQMDPARAERVLDGLPRGVTRVHLSGIGRSADVARVRERGVDAALVGEALMRAADPEPLLREFAAEARGPT